MAPLGVLEVAVAAVDDGVAGRQQRRELLEGRLGGIARGHHQPHDARAGQRGDRLLGAEGALDALGHDLVRLLGRAVEGHHAVAGEVQPTAHVGAHAPESDDDEVHGRWLLLGRVRRGSVRRALAASRVSSSASPASGSSERWMRSTGQAVRLERGEVAQRLGVDEHPEGLLAARDGQVVGVARDQLQEAARRRAALVQLPGRVQEPRAVAQGRGVPCPVAQQRLDPAQRGGPLRRRSRRRHRWRGSRCSPMRARCARSTSTAAVAAGRRQLRGERARRRTAGAVRSWRSRLPPGMAP